DPGRRGRRARAGRARDGAASLRGGPAGPRAAVGDRGRATRDRRAPAGRSPRAGAAAGRQHRVARAEPHLARRPRARATLDASVVRAGVPALPEAGLREADGAGRGRRLLVLLPRPVALLVLRRPAARPGARSGRAGPGGRDRAAQTGSGARGGAGPRPQPDRGLLRLAAGLGLLPRLSARTLRDAGFLAPPRRLLAQAARGHRRRPAAGGADLLPPRSQERVD